jgi:hypothetical protein
MDNYHFESSISIEEETGTLLAFYHQVRTGKSVKQIEFADGNLIADYDSRGRLLGVELLGPCSLAELKKAFKGEPRLLAIVQSNAPRTAIVA